MKVFVTGVNGQLGHDMLEVLTARGHTAIGSDIVLSDVSGKTPCIALDITDEAAVSRTLAQIRPDAVIHCAAWTAVDAAEDAENRDRVAAVNADGTRYIANACSALGCKMMLISTDYVFSGQGEAPWLADCTDFAPQNVYGETKLAAEEAVRALLERYFIVRIAWVFGLNGNNFVKTMLNLGKKYTQLRVVCDQIGTPTYTLDLARLLVDMIESEKFGCYHATNAQEHYISWYDFACEIFRQAGLVVEVIPVTTSEYGLSKAKRPFNSRLDKGKLAENGFAPLPDWQDALSRYLLTLKQEEMRENGDKANA